MKAFLEEYGITVVVSVVITALIGVGVVFADTGGNTLKGFVNNFQNEAQLTATEPEPEPEPVVLTASYETYKGTRTISYEEGMTWGEWLQSDYADFAYAICETGDSWPTVIDYAPYRIYLVNSSPDAKVGVMIMLSDVINGHESAAYGPCFVAGTQIQIDLEGHTKNIEDVQVGDQIVSWDVEAGMPYLTTVDKTWEKSCDTISTLVLSDGTITKLTPNHPLLVGKQWKSIDPNFAGPLKEYESTMLYKGDEITKIIGKSAVVDIDTIVYNKPVLVYNLSVISNNSDRNNNNYIANGMVAHNY